MTAGNADVDQQKNGKQPQGGSDRLEEAFSLALSDLYEANAAAQICNSFIHKHEKLSAEPVQRQKVWYFFDQAVSWKLAMALERLTQKPRKDRASLTGLLREIDAAREGGREFHDEETLKAAEAKLREALDLEICKSLQASRNAFMGHSLIGQSRSGVKLYDLIEFLGTLETIADDLNYGVFGIVPPLDDHIAQWQMLALDWFNRILPEDTALEN